MIKPLLAQDLLILCSSEVAVHLSLVSFLLSWFSAKITYIKALWPFHFTASKLLFNHLIYSFLVLLYANFLPNLLIIGLTVISVIAPKQHLPMFGENTQTMCGISGKDFSSGTWLSHIQDRSHSHLQSLSMLLLSTLGLLGLLSLNSSTRQYFCPLLANLDLNLVLLIAFESLFSGSSFMIWLYT